MNPRIVKTGLACAALALGGIVSRAEGPPHPRDAFIGVWACRGVKATPWLWTLHADGTLAAASATARQPQQGVWQPVDERTAITTAVAQTVSRLGEVRLEKERTRATLGPDGALSVQREAESSAGDRAALARVLPGATCARVRLEHPKGPGF